MKVLIKRPDINKPDEYIIFRGNNTKEALAEGFVWEEEPINIDQLKQQKLLELKTNLESFFYSKYPIYRQNNLAIYGTEEERQEFKRFHDDLVSQYDFIVDEINNEEDIERLKKFKTEFWKNTKED